MPENDNRRSLGIFMIVVAYGLAGIIWFFMYVNGVCPYWIVFGRVLDDFGNPIAQASVTASLGIGADTTVMTEANGNFRVTVALYAWSGAKGGAPAIIVDKPGYRRNLSRYKEWRWGPKFTRVVIKLQESVLAEDQEALKDREEELRPPRENR